MPTAPLSVIRLTLPATADNVALCRDLLASVARPAGLSPEELDDLRGALGEAVANAVVHGPHGEGATVEVVYRVLPGAVVIEVTDEGAGFDADEVERAEAVREGLPERGLGLVLVRALADEVEFGARHGSDGCCVRLVKRRSAA